MDAFWNWFIGEAGAAWIFGLIGIAAGLYAWFKHERPSRIYIQEISNENLLSISPQHSEKLQLTYKNEKGETQEITNLQQKVFVIYNGGTKDLLDSINFTIHVEDDSYTAEENNLCELFINEPQITYNVQGNKEKNLFKTFAISIPFLNSYEKHEHLIWGYLLTDTDISITKINNRIGKGWSVYFVARYNDPHELLKPLQYIKWIAKGISWILMAFAAILFLWAIYRPYAEYPQILPWNMTKNIDQTLEYYREYLTLYQNGGVLKTIFSNSPLSLGWIFLSGFLFFFAFIIEPLLVGFGGYIYYNWLGLLPFEKFHKNDFPPIPNHSSD